MDLTSVCRFARVAAIYYMKSVAIRRPTYKPIPVPTMDSENAVMVPTNAPSHQPIVPPTNEPVKPRIFAMPDALQIERSSYGIVDAVTGTPVKWLP